MLAADVARRVATRTDDAAQSTERASFFGASGMRVFGVLHAPVHRASRAVVICPATSAESLTTYRHDVMLARQLAARGIAALRFHYRGTGHSDGDEEELTFESMKADALTAATQLAEQVDVAPTAFVGTRLGSIVATAAAAEHGAAPLILWEPVLEGRRYFREAWRARAIFGIKEGTPQAGKALADVLAAEGVVDILGYPIFPALYDTASERTLLNEAGSGGRPGLLLHGQAATARQAELDRVTAALRERGCQVEVAVLPFELVWWFIGPAKIRQVTGQVIELVEKTVTWLDGLPRDADA
jgi:alpha/beta superfamily hydrolase